MSKFQFAPFVQILLLLVLCGALIRRKRSGRWKRPWTFPVAMALLGLAIVLGSLAQVLAYFGM